jgi:hypothetical protein
MSLTERFLFGFPFGEGLLSLAAEEGVGGIIRKYRAFDLSRQHLQMTGKPLEQLPLPFVASRVSDQLALGHVSSQPFQARYHVLHRVATTHQPERRS